jgi:hypothetical protein
MFWVSEASVAGLQWVMWVRSGCWDYGCALPVVGGGDGDSMVGCSWG